MKPRPRHRLGGVATELVILSLVFFAAHSAVGLDVAPPSIPTLPVDLFDTDTYGRLPARLLGVDLMQDGEALDADYPRIDPTQELVVRTHWEPVTRIDSRLQVRVSLWDHTCLVRFDYEFSVGPESANSVWEIGEAVSDDLALDFREAGRSFSGDAYLTITMLTPRDRERQQRPLQLVNVNLGPSLRPTDISRGQLRQRVGEDFYLAPHATRLGVGAEYSFSAPDGARAYSRLLIISSMSYRSPPQGEIVCDIVFRNDAGVEIRETLRAGETTARCDYDAYPPGGVNHESIEIFRSRDSSQLDREGRPVRLHAYIAEIEIPASLGPLQDVTLRCTWGTMLDLFGLVLVP